LIFDVKMESQTESKKKEIVSFFLEKGLLVTEDLLGALEDKESIEKIYSLISEEKSADILVLNNDIKKILCKGNAKGIIGKELEKTAVLAQKHNKTEAYSNAMEVIESSGRKESCEKNEDIKIIKSYNGEDKKREIQDFVSYFNARYKAVEKILRQRAEMQGVLSIGRVVAKRDKETVAIIGIVSSKDVTKNNNLILSVEDSTGEIKVHINKNKPQLYEQAKDIVLDEVIGVVGGNSQNVVFANQIIWPDIPQKRLKKAEDEKYAVFLSDLHVGSNNFLKSEFEKFLKWISGEVGSETQKALAEKIDYIFIVGDLVDGVGIYPGQETELVLDDIYRQYDECAALLKQIPSRIKIVICPGNHDAMRIAEPQPELYKDLANPIWALENVKMTTNPCLVNIGSSEDFSGFDVLLYHGYSFDYFVANVDSIRNGGGYDRADLIMKFLLQRRHLAPSHSSTLYIPEASEDSLVIDKVPDFFVTGHIHKTSVANYKGVTMICGSCWQSKTSFQEKVGHHPEPCRVPIVNLKTRDVKILKFGK